jgi:hypothetical protein
MSFYLVAEWPGWTEAGIGQGTEVIIEVILSLYVILPSD